jgi:hypothetical protein
MDSRWGPCYRFESVKDAVWSQASDVTLYLVHATNLDQRAVFALLQLQFQSRMSIRKSLGLDSSLLPERLPASIFCFYGRRTSGGRKPSASQVVILQ